MVLKGEVSGRRILEAGNWKHGSSAGAFLWFPRLDFQGNTGCLPTRAPHGLGLWRGSRGRGVQSPQSRGFLGLGQPSAGP